MSESDEKVKKHISLKLFKDRHIDASKIKAEVVNGIVTLEGTLYTLWQKSRVEKMVKKVSGVKDIINKILILPQKSVIIRDLFSDKLTDERLIHIVNAHLSKMECYFGLIGTLIAVVFITISAILTPNYSPLTNTVSSLGRGISKTLFSIGFVCSGCLGIPFLLYLEKTLRGINEFVRRIATTIAIISSLSIALVGILPDPEYPETFLIFHGTVAFNAFVGSVIYICLYSYLMLKSPDYKLYHVIVGFATAIDLLLLVITQFNPLVEWILTINIMAWVLITSLSLITK